MKPWLAILLPLIILLSPPKQAVLASLPIQPRALFADDFDDNAIDTAYWQASTLGSGPVVAETQGHLQVTIPGTSEDDPTFADIMRAPHGGFWGGYISRCYLWGDFDIQVDYSLLTWPAMNGVRTALAIIPITSTLTAVERTSFGASEGSFSWPREVYVDHFADSPVVVATNHITGTLRMIRTGSKTSGYYRDGQQWLRIHSGPNSSGNVKIALLAWGHHPGFANQDVAVAFDNFVVNKGILCPRQTWAPLVESNGEVFN